MMKKSLMMLSICLAIFMALGGIQSIALGEEPPTTTASPTTAAVPEPAVTVEVISGMVGFQQTDASGQPVGAPVALTANTVTEIAPASNGAAPTVTTNLIDEQTLTNISTQVKAVIETATQQQASELNNRNQAMMEIAEYVDPTDTEDKAKFQNIIQAVQESFSTLSFDVRQKMSTLGIELPDATNTALLATQESMNTFLATDTGKNLLGTGSGSVSSQLQEDSLKFLDQMKDNLRLANNYSNDTVSSLPLFSSIENLESTLVNAGVPTSNIMFKLEAPEGYTLPQVDVTQVPDITGFILPPGISDLASKTAEFFNNLPEGVVLPTDLTNLPGDTTLPANSTLLPCEVFGEGVLLEILSSGGTRLPANFTETLQKLADAGESMVLPPGIVLPPGLDIPEGSTVTFGSNTMLPPGMDLSNFKVGSGNSSGSNTGIPSYLLNDLSEAAKTQATQLYTQIETFLAGRFASQLSAADLATLQGMESSLNTALGLPAGSSPGGLGKSQITLPEGIELPAGVTLPDGATLPTGTQLPEGIQLPDGVSLPTGIEIPEGATLPNNIILPDNVQFKGEITMPENFILPSNMESNLPSWMQQQMTNGSSGQYFMPDNWSASDLPSDWTFNDVQQLQNMSSGWTPEMIPSGWTPADIPSTWTPGTIDSTLTPEQIQNMPADWQPGQVIDPTWINSTGGGTMPDPTGGGTMPPFTPPFTPPPIDGPGM